MDLTFTFPPIKSQQANVIWKYTLERSLENGKKREIVHGYFQLDQQYPTTIDLTDAYETDRKNLKWIRFSCCNPNNPMKRAWFNPIKGEGFGSPNNPGMYKLQGKSQLTLTHFLDFMSHRI